MKKIIKLAGLRVLAEQRESRNLKVKRMRGTFGDRLSKAMIAEVTQMENEITGIDEIVALVEAQPEEA